MQCNHLPGIVGKFYFEGKVEGVDHAFLDKF